MGHDASVDGGNRSSWQPNSIEMVGVEAIPARIRVRDNDLFYLFAIVGVHRRVFDGVSICDSSRGGLVVIVKMVVE